MHDSMQREHGAEPLLEATAAQERRLLAVGCNALFGEVRAFPSDSTRALAAICLAFGIDLKCCLRSEKAHIEFHAKVHLAQDHWHICRLRPGKREL